MNSPIKRSFRPKLSIMDSHNEVPTLNTPRSVFINTPSSTNLYSVRSSISEKLKNLTPFHSKGESIFKTGSDTIHLLEVPNSNPFGSFSPAGSHRSHSIRLSKPKARDRTYRSVDFTKRLSMMGNQAEPDDSDQYKKRLWTPCKDEKVQIEDEKPQTIIGEEAITNFYSHYKKLDKVKDVNNFMQVKDAVYTSFLGKSESLKLFPSKIGFIKEKGDLEKITLNHYRIGDKYAEVLSEGLKSVKGLQKIELANNRISSVGADHILSKLTNQTEILNLSGNNIGRIGCEHLCSIVTLKHSKLIEVNLEGNKLGDSAVGQLCDAIITNFSLRKLNLGKNFLSDKVTEKVSRMLELNSSLEELYLQWNQIKSQGGTNLVNGLQQAPKLRVLDLSWNSLGQNGSQFAKSFAAYIAGNTTLIHLDLSNNYINKEDTKIIAEDLKANHSLYGLHFHGNMGYVDFKGFLVALENLDTLSGRVSQPAINSINPQSDSLKHHIGNWGEYRDVCWICEGWRPMELIWKPDESGQGDRDPIYVHLSFEGYKGVFLNSKNEFKVVRMVPPTQFEYFFTVDDLPTIAADHKSCKPQSSSIITAKIGEEEKQVKIEEANFCEKTKLSQVLDEEYDLVEKVKDFDIKPRVPDEVYIPPEVQVIRPKWKLPVSIFRTFRIDSPALLDDCFKVDFENTRITKIVKNADDLKVVREILYESYRGLKDCYKHFAAIGAPSEIWSIPLNTFTDFCNNAKIIDNKILKLSDFDRIFIATYTKPPDREKNHRNPDRALVRYQFLEGLVRLAEHKYIGSGIVPTYGEALKLMMDECLGSFLKNFNHHSWREERYWNEDVDTILKSYFPILRGIYKKYSGQKTLPGQKKYMCLEEFHRLMSDTQMYNDNCGERDATLAFNLAMMTQVDELNSDRIYQMQFVEFLEALSRIADKFSSHPYGWSAIHPVTGQMEAEIPYEQRFAQPLYVKLEGLMPVLFSVCGNDVKELWSLPETSVYQMKEVDAKQKFSTKKKKILRINPTHANSIEPYEGFNALQV